MADQPADLSEIKSMLQSIQSKLAQDQSQLILSLVTNINQNVEQILATVQSLPTSDGGTTQLISELMNNVSEVQGSISQVQNTLDEMDSNGGGLA